MGVVGKEPAPSCIEPRPPLVPLNVVEAFEGKGPKRSAGRVALLFDEEEGGAGDGSRLRPARLSEMAPDDSAAGSSKLIKLVSGAFCLPEARLCVVN